MKKDILHKLFTIKTNSMTGDEFLVLIALIAIIGLLLSSVIWWIGTDIIHELRHRNFLLKEQNQNKDE